MTDVEVPGAGRLQGREHPEVAGVVEFLGVPYATAARFSAPHPVAPWIGIRDATAHGPVAPQLSSRLGPVMGAGDDLPQGEDCLTVDVRTPGADTAGRPVVVWLHGGAYVGGSASQSWYDPARLVAEGDVVVVGVHYRLGALGYLWWPGVTPGNLGLLDQLAALRWVRDHIAAFGGDPDRVTVMGQSAGAHSIACLLAVPEADGLFGRAILQSGQLGLGVGTTGEAAGIARWFAAALDDLGAHPATAPVATILEAQRRTQVRAAGPGGLNASPPLVPVAGVDPLPDAAAWAAAPIRRARDVDVLVGATDDEAETFVRIGPALAAARSLPLVGRAVSVGAAAQTRRVFTAPADRFADDVARTGGRAFSYRFSWRAPDTDLGACHCIELPFLFGTRKAFADAPMLAGADWDRDVEPLGRRMRAAWLSFARHGDPAATGEVSWAPHVPGEGPTMRWSAAGG